ncbi:MAG: hypothetical protein JO100_06985 [Pseudonocardia sp.]|nr:hypothetical protein [Pseudonocardia sp.]
MSERLLELVDCRCQRGRYVTPSADTTADGENSQPEGDHELPELIGLAIDGKTVRNSDQPNQPGSEIKLFSALLIADKTVIAQVRTIVYLTAAKLQLPTLANPTPVYMPSH